MACKETEVGYMVLVASSWMSYIGSTTTVSDLSLCELESPRSRSYIFQSILSLKGVELGHLYYILLNTSRKSYWKSNCTIRF